jgi:hypothetical protein
MNETKPREKLPTVLIQGKEYTLVKDRVLYFNEVCPNGSIRTEILSDLHEDRFLINAIVTPDADYPSRVFTGKSQAIVGDGYINKTAALENAETSAVGRALAMMGIGVIESIASADEINKAKNSVQAEVEHQKRHPSNPTGPALTGALQASVDQQTAKETPEMRAARERTALAQQQGTFSLDGDVLTCKVVGIQKKQMGEKTKTPGKEYRSVTFNGRFHETSGNYASCFDTELWDSLDACLDHDCQLKVEFSKDGKFVNVTDVLATKPPFRTVEPLFEGA